MAVVVTGAAGFIGRQVVATLRRLGREVVGIDRRAWVPAPGERSVVADLAERDPLVDRVLHDADGVIHLAACPGVRDRRPDIAVRRWRDNVVAGTRVLETTPAATPVVVASSSSVYGGAGPALRPRPCRETDTLAPLGGYAWSKTALEQRAAARAADGGLVGVARPFTVAGEGQRPDMAIATWIDALLGGRTIVLFGSGARRRDITDVRDVADGLVRMLDRRVTATVNLGTGVTHPLDEVVALVAQRCGVEPRVQVAQVAAEDVPATRADVETCRRLLGFVPTTDLPALIDRQVRATVVARPRMSWRVLPRRASLPATRPPARSSRIEGVLPGR
ncbi:MAG: NAD(P)-dependent oxidoreductase [Actinobacteria bacterium]|nr:NAD(P)-dependent oxidoreductase [Actinomycetota bacterium]